MLTNGTSSSISSGVSSRASMPHAVADVMRRLNSSSRSAERATSMPPHVVFSPSSTYWRWLSSVSSAISLLWSVGKMKFEAWPVEPPGLGSGPLSSSTMSVQPRRARCPTRQLPTMPAPMTTHRGVRWGDQLTCALRRSNADISSPYHFAQRPRLPRDPADDHRPRAAPGRGACARPTSSSGSASGARRSARPCSGWPASSSSPSCPRRGMLVTGIDVADLGDALRDPGGAGALRRPPGLRSRATRALGADGRRARPPAPPVAVARRAARRRSRAATS